MAKINKETLIKHIFWIGLGGYVLLWAIGLLCILTISGGAVAEKAGEFKKSKDAVDGLKKGNIEEGKIANESFTDLWKEKKKKLEDHKLVVWRDSYNGQNKVTADSQDPLFFWPEEMANTKDSKTEEEYAKASQDYDKAMADWTKAKDEAVKNGGMPPEQPPAPPQPPMLKDRPFGSRFDGEPGKSATLRGDYQATFYKNQLSIFQTAREGSYLSPIGPAYFNGSWEAVVQPVVWDKEKATPDERDVWLAQEDLCVKREVLRIVREAIDTVGRFKVVEREYKDRDGKPLALRVPTDEFTLVPAPARDDKGLGYLADITFPRKYKLPVAQTAEELEQQRQKIRDFMETAKSEREKDVAAIEAGAASAFFRLRSTCWELELFVEKDAKKGGLQISTKSTLKNVHPDGRSLERNGVVFRLQPRDAAGMAREIVWIMTEGDPLKRYVESDKSTVVPLLAEPIALPNAKFSQTAELDQIFNWGNSPVKRLDKIEVGTERARSHRTAIRPLMPAEQFPVSTETTTTDNTSSNTMTPPGGGGSSGFGPMGPMGGTGSGDGGLGSTTGSRPLGTVSPLRYIDTSQQVRRLPIGMVLVVDQAHVPEVLTAIANSRLQMWTTQVHWKHTSGIQPPPETLTAGGTPTQPGSPEGGLGPMGPVGPMGPMGGGSRMGPPPGMRLPPGGGMTYPGPRPPGGGIGPGTGSGPGTGDGGTGVPATSLAVVQDNPNLVELAVYSIASIYEKPADKKDAASGAPK